jgi:hypothetical protein
MKKQEQQTLVIDINLTRGLVALLIGGLLVVAALGYLTWMQDEVKASPEQAPLAALTGIRQYYLTISDTYTGKYALTACGDGYHMASLWEIMDPSNLKYNTTLGYTQDDSGQGPPVGTTNAVGWVRTGYISNTSTTAGQANCGTWTTESSIERGTAVNLADNWTSGGGAQDIHVWNVQDILCIGANRVWCVED